MERCREGKIEWAGTHKGEINCFWHKSLLRSLNVFLSVQGQRDPVAFVLLSLHFWVSESGKSCGLIPEQSQAQSPHLTWAEPDMDMMYCNMMTSPSNSAVTERLRAAFTLPVSRSLCFAFWSQQVSTRSQVEMNYLNVEELFSSDDVIRRRLQPFRHNVLTGGRS